VTTLYWLRHGESPVNLTKQFSYKRVDPGLTAKGALQARQAAEYLRRCEVEALYCSPMLRAVQTAQIIGAALGLPVTVVEEFRELNVGDLELLPPSQAAWDIYGRVMEAWAARQHDVAFPGGENWYELRSRLFAGLQRVTANGAGPVLVVGHGGSFVSLLGELCPGLDLNTLPSDNPNCAVSEVAIACGPDGRLTGELLRYGEHGHLHGQAAVLVSGLPDADTFKA
jgi:broad specificity phosphatase PhoE